MESGRHTRCCVLLNALLIPSWGSALDYDCNALAVDDRECRVRATLAGSMILWLEDALRMIQALSSSAAILNIEYLAHNLAFLLALP